jgi:hypothetical protein
MEWNGIAGAARNRTRSTPQLLIVSWTATPCGWKSRATDCPMASCTLWRILRAVTFQRRTLGMSQRTHQRKALFARHRGRKRPADRRTRRRAAAGRHQSRHRGNGRHRAEARGKPAGGTDLDLQPERHRHRAPRRAEPARPGRTMPNMGGFEPPGWQGATMSISMRGVSSGSPSEPLERHQRLRPMSTA